MKELRVRIDDSYQLIRKLASSLNSIIVSLESQEIETIDEDLRNLEKLSEDIEKLDDKIGYIELDDLEMEYDNVYIPDLVYYLEFTDRVKLDELIEILTANKIIKDQ